MLSSLQIEPGEPEPRILQLEILMNIHIRNDIGWDSERVAVVQEVTIVIIPFDPATPTGRGMFIRHLGIQHIGRHVGDLLAIPGQKVGRPI